MIQWRGKDSPTILVFIASALILIIHHVYAYTGHYGYDDLHYARLANDLMNGHMDFNDHYSFRWPILILTALSFKVFGINDFAAAIPSLFVGICTQYLVYTIIKPYGIKALIIGLGLTALDGWSLHYSDKIMPDIYINLAVMLVVYFIYRFKFSLQSKNVRWCAFGLAASFLFGFMAKESMLLVLPLLAYLFVVDFFLKRDLQFWKWSFLFAVLFFVLYFGLIAVLTGSAGQRFTAILQNPYLSLCSYSVQSLSFLIKRISYQFLALLINTGLFVAPGIVLLCLFRNWNKQFLLFKDEFGFFGIVVLLLLFSCNFMSASMTSYNPLCLDPRHYMFLIPISAIMASRFLSEKLENNKLNQALVLLFLFLAVVSYLNSEHEFKFLYLPLLFLFLLNALLFKNKIFKIIFQFLFVAILFLKLFDKIRFAKELDYATQKQVVMDQFVSTTKNAYVITDIVQKRLGEYYNGFSKNGSLQFLKFDDFQPDTLDKKKELYILLNKYTQQLSNLNAEDLPYYALNVDSSVLIFQEEKIQLSIYKLNQISIPSIVSEFKTDFEVLTDSNVKLISNQIKLSGEHSNKIEEYSYTYQYPLDSIHFESDQKLLIQLKIAFWKDLPSKASIIISMDENTTPYIYQSNSCDHYVKAFSNWNQAEVSFVVESSKIKPASNLKIYIWNPEKKEMYMDDFEVKLSIIR